MAENDDKYLLIKQLIDEVALYEKTASSQPLHLQGFLSYLSSKNPVKRPVAGPLEPQMQEEGNTPETEIAILVTFIHRYAKLYGKKVLGHSAIGSLDDFSYLITLITHESLSKTELIQKNAHEKTTGMEIIKRLVRHGFIEQFDNSDDRRSQRVAITVAGRQAVFAVLPGLAKVSAIMTGNLDPAEKIMLGKILKKLDHFHFDIYMNDRNRELDDIIRDRVLANRQP